MENQKNIHEKLIYYAILGLEKVVGEISEIFKEYSLDLMSYVESKVSKRLVEVRFDDFRATITFSMNEDSICDNSFLFFDDVREEDAFLDHLAESAKYNSRKNCWQLPTSFVKMQVAKDISSFVFFR